MIPNEQNINVDELTGEIKPEVQTQEQPFEAPKKTSVAAPSVANSNTQNMITYVAWDGSEIKLSLQLAQKLCDGGGSLTPDEFLLFAAKCKARKLNPFTKECYPIKFAGENQKVAIIEDWHNFQRAADENPAYDGTEAGLVIETKEGEIKDVEGQILPKDCKLIGGWAKVYRKDRKFPAVARLNLDEFGKKHKYDVPAKKIKAGDFMGTWSAENGMQAYMIWKCANACALQIAFPKQLAGSVIPEMMQERVIEEGTATAII